MKKLGFGLMRLPMIGKEVDIEQTKQMVDVFMQNGFTYFDTAWGYSGGKSEMAAKQALVDRYPRESFQLATKLPAWLAKSEEDAKAMFETSMERTGAGYFDYYLLHNLGGDRTAMFTDWGIWDYLQEKKQQGLIRKLGFSFHDTADVLDRILTEHPEMDFVQLQINYADWESDNVQSRLCYETAVKHGKPVIIMEPVKGGSLANMPDAIAHPMTDYAPDASQSSWALRFAAGLENVLMVLSGMSTLEQMKENVAVMAEVKPLSEEEHAVLNQVNENLKKTDSVPCTGCGYCVKGCPMGINIPSIFSAYNTHKIYDYLAGAKRSYGFATAKVQPDVCIACGQCEAVCPQKIAIIDTLKEAHELLR